MNREEIHYRVLFESINKFSIAVFNAYGSNEVLQILKTKIKYLINCSWFEFYYLSGDNVEKFCVAEAESTNLSIYDVAPWMLELYHSGLPYHHVEEKGETVTETRGWSFRQHEGFGSLIIIRSDQNAPFTNRYVTMVKLINEILCAKLNNYRLIRELDEKNNKIESLALEQEKLIETRTKKLKESNQNLTQLIQFNTHQIREPITRAISLMDIKDDLGMEMWEEEFWPDMKQAVSDLDEAVKSIVSKVDRLEPKNI